MRGELDWLVMRCLEKDRTRRYDTASALARDVERYLRDEPVEACPPSAGYRLRKLARKYKKPLAAAAAFAALLLAGLAVVTWEWRAERAARSDADAARDDAEAKAREISELAERMNEANAAIDLAGQHSMLARWSAAEAACGRAIDLRPDHARVWLQRGELYGTMGLWDLALDDYRQSFGLRPPDIVLPWCKYALLTLLRGDQASYRDICRRMLERFGDSKESFVQGLLTRACSFLPSPDTAHDWRLAPEDLSRIPSSVVWAGRYESGLAHSAPVAIPRRSATCASPSPSPGTTPGH
jgi:tetratricopeptide (TPR) repeat protein